MIADALDYRRGAAVAHRKAFTSATGGKETTTGRPIQYGIAEDHIAVGHKAGVLMGTNDQLAAAQALAHIVLGFAIKPQIETVQPKGPKALTSGTGEADLNLTVGQAFVAITQGQLTSQLGANGALRIADLVRQPHRCIRIGAQTRQHLFDNVIANRRLGRQFVAGQYIAPDVTSVRHIEQRQQIHKASLAPKDHLFEHFGMADHLIQVAIAQIGQHLAHLLGHIGQEIHDHLRCAIKLFAQFRVLGGDADGTGVFVTDTRHDTALGNHRAGAKAVFVGPQHRRHHHIATGGDPAVGAQADAVADAVDQQGLVGFGQADFPRQTNRFDAAQRAGAGAAAVAADVDDIGIAFGNTGGNRTNAHFRDQFDADFGRWVHGFQVIDQLGQVFNAVNVMMGRRADQRNARRTVAQHRNLCRDFVTRQLAALTWFRALRHLDLQLFGAHQIFWCDAKATRRHLFDLAGALGEVAIFGFTAFTAVAHAAQPVHGNG